MDLPVLPDFRTSHVSNPLMQANLGIGTLEGRDAQFQTITTWF